MMKTRRFHITDPIITRLILAILTILMILLPLNATPAYAEGSITNDAMNTQTTDPYDPYANETTDPNGTSDTEITEQLLPPYELEDGILIWPDYRDYYYLDITYTSPIEQKAYITSEDESVVKVSSGEEVKDVYQCHSYDTTDYFSVTLEKVGYGKTNITVKMGAEELKIPVIVLPEYVTMKDPVQTGFTRQTLEWEPYPGVDGYYIKKFRYVEDLSTLDNSDCEIIRTIPGGTSSKAVLDSYWDEKGRYFVSAYIEYNGKIYDGDLGQNTKYNSMGFETKRMNVPLKSVTKKSSTSLDITWDIPDQGATYDLYRSLDENNNYKLIGTYTDANAKNGAITVTDNVKQGTQYFYKLVTRMGDKAAPDHDTIAYMIPKSLKSVKKVTNKSLGYPNRSYQYMEGSTHKIVSWYTEYKNNKNILKLKIRSYDKNKKFKSTKTINLTKAFKCDTVGGFYHAPDGNNYLAIGYYNFKESRTKTVIKIVKYDKNWKKLKTASIKGNAGNEFDGIVDPFRAGTVAFDMLGSKLYVFTARTMFKDENDINHQSNIAFEVDTKTMKAKERNISYCSHSFDQFVRFKDGSIYLADHGDAYPRGIQVTWADRYGENDETYSSETPFYFLGETGDNFTGANLNGFEVTKNNIIVAGVAQPHNYKIKGTKGFERYSKNLFVTITSRKTGKSTVKWLTKLDPKKKKEAAGVWMKKLTDDRLALIYFIRNNNTDKSTFYYMVIDETGKKIYKKTLKGVTAPSTRDLILKDGRIWWFTHTSDYQDATYKNGVYKIKNVKGNTVFYGIPAVWN